jgi:MFS family permease
VLSIIPGLLAVAAILCAIRHTAAAGEGEHRPIRLHVRPVLRGRLGRLMIGISVFELGNVAATLLILRASDLLTPSHGMDDATKIAIALYVVYNLAATLVSVPAGRLGDRHGMVRVLAAGVAAFGLAYAGFAATAASIPRLAAAFALAGIGIGCVETAEHAAVATLAPENVRGSAFGVLAAVQSLGNLVASTAAGLIYTVVSPAAAFTVAAALMAAALIVLTANRSASR